MERTDEGRVKHVRCFELEGMVPIGRSKKAWDEILRRYQET